MFFYSVVYEETNFLIINKSSGLLVHKNKYDSVHNLIDSINRDKDQKFFLINRIDKNTSGLLLVAKNKEAVTKFQDLFKNKEIQKEYLAIVTNALPAKEVKINLSLGKSKSNKLMFSSWNATRYKSAVTYAYKLDKNLIKLIIYTGRTHQIRAHLFSIKCPILNDPIYGKKTNSNDNFGQYLHSYSLTFTNPFNAQKICVTTPPPAEFINKLKELNIQLELPEQDVIEIDDQLVEWNNPYNELSENHINNNLDINNFAEDLSNLPHHRNSSEDINDEIYEDINDEIYEDKSMESQLNKFLNFSEQDEENLEHFYNNPEDKNADYVEATQNLMDSGIVDNPELLNSPTQEEVVADFNNLDTNIFDHEAPDDQPKIEEEKVDFNNTEEEIFSAQESAEKENISTNEDVLHIEKLLEKEQ